MKILFGLSGSIAAYKACHVLSRLVQNGHEIQTIASASALQFIGPATLEGLTGRPPLSETFTPGRHMEHIHLMRWADLVILCPASANSLNKMASGVADDLWSTLFLAHDFSKPYLLAPAMNASMLAHPATQHALATLKSWGLEILATDTGNLACGKSGAGRLLDPDLIVQAIEDHLQQPAKPLHILITSGGTREPIDAVRAIANFSSGRTGASLADYFTQRGHRVFFLRADASAPPQSHLRQETFVSFTDLEMKLKNLLQTEPFDLVIHAAAVSDYAVESIEANGQTQTVDTATKLPSAPEQMILKLKKNPKILAQIKTNSAHQPVKVVAFKLTHTTDLKARRQAAQALSPWADLVVQNDLSNIDAHRHEAHLYQGEQEIAHTYSKRQLAQTLEQWATQGEGL